MISFYYRLIMAPNLKSVFSTVHQEHTRRSRTQIQDLLKKNKSFFHLYLFPWALIGQYNERICCPIIYCHCVLSVHLQVYISSRINFYWQQGALCTKLWWSWTGKDLAMLDSSEITGMWIFSGAAPSQQERAESMWSGSALKSFFCIYSVRSETS